MCGGGENEPNIYNIIDFVTIATAGNAADFGDMLTQNRLSASASNGHGGIEIGELQRPSVTYMPGS